MRKTIAISILLTFCCTIGLMAENVTMKGSYRWTKGTKIRGKGDDLVAVFTSAGRNKWDVKFDFAWHKTPHTYKGTATGSVKFGTLKGTVKTENGKRTFCFTGNVKNGLFSGTHTEIRKNRNKTSERDTGTFSMKIN